MKDVWPSQTSKTEASLDCFSQVMLHTRTAGKTLTLNPDGGYTTCGGVEVEVWRWRRGGEGGRAGGWRWRCEGWRCKGWKCTGHLLCRTGTKVILWNKVESSGTNKDVSAIAAFCLILRRRIRTNKTVNHYSKCYQSYPSSYY